ncbi:hypothetical protein, partial [Pedobacter suwonensis]|uniref:hypothetical protein n=1 Tax=Pedobacter suwonensis TaxID=332999 RepID=UPI003D08BEBC
MNGQMLLAVFSPAPASAPDETCKISKHTNKKQKTVLKSVAYRSDRVYIQWLGSFGYMPGAGHS